MHARLELAVEAQGIEAQIRGVAAKVPIGERALILEEHVVHLPELALRGGGFGGLRGALRVRVDVAQREMSEHEPEL